MRDRAVDGFLALLATRRAASTVEAYRRDLEQAAARLGKPVSTATAEDLRTYLAGLRDDGADAVAASASAATRSTGRDPLPGHGR